MSNVREIELRRRRDEILRETMELTSNVVQSLDQQQKYVFDTKESLHNQNLILSLANDKMRLMNQNLISVVDEINNIDNHHGCLCFKQKIIRKKKNQQMTLLNTTQKSNVNKENDLIISKLIENNEQEQMIVKQLNQMKSQLVIFQKQVQIVNDTFDEGDEILHQLGAETNRYMNSINIALDKAEQILSSN